MNPVDTLVESLLLGRPIGTLLESFNASDYDSVWGKNRHGSMSLNEYLRIAATCGTSKVPYDLGACTDFAMGLHEFLGSDPSDKFLVAWRAPKASITKDLRRLYHVLLKHKGELFDGSGIASRGLRKARAVEEFPISSYQELRSYMAWNRTTPSEVASALAAAYPAASEKYPKSADDQPWSV